MAHWLTRFDVEDGEPYGTVCHCRIGRDHTQSELIEMIQGWTAELESDEDVEPDA